ncbi:histidine kinase [Hymenobacter chitinivorans]|uniref:Two component regulator with propeller domain n=1 Tax=Hymenobacter chitinivorans DSM 11115 TaxID=1121954 RepID=A0A2M9BT76_9BACT|nr:histidine kinase [Hymenobacter chitinivorans]PJJ61160.1 two component regulator with propeller domain [Hymenobacter chitinivorans DSM 11115]
MLPRRLRHLLFYASLSFVLFFAPAALAQQHVLLIDQQGRVWEAAAPGLRLTEPTGTTRFTTRNGLSNDTITALAQDAAGQVWVGTREGLLVYEGAGFREVTYQEGLPSKQITALYQAADGPLWIGTRAGAVRSENRRLTPVAELRGLDVQFIGEDARSWVFVTRQGIRRLPKEPPFSWQWLGWAAAGALLLGGVLWTRRRRHRGQHVQLRLAQTEQQALLAQMNPHFVFNSLQSIQKYILRHESEAAQHYLARFGGLMRLILEQSRQPQLPVRTELNLLRTYLELEALRFEQQFTYAVQADEHLLDEEIPAMLLHPFVENAVWHGLAHHTGQGHVAVRISGEGEYLVAVVEDNGVGRQRAAGQSGTHAGFPSRGMAIVQERVALLSRQSRLPISIEIVDLAQPGSTAQGTRVVVRIPRQHS